MGQPAPVNVYPPDIEIVSEPLASSSPNIPGEIGTFMDNYLSDTIDK